MGIGIAILGATKRWIGWACVCLSVVMLTGDGVWAWWSHQHIEVWERYGQGWMSNGAPLPLGRFRLDKGQPYLNMYIGCTYQWFDPQVISASDETLGITIEVPLDFKGKPDYKSGDIWKVNGIGDFSTRAGYNSYSAILQDVQGGRHNASQAFYFMPVKAAANRPYDIFFHVSNNKEILFNGQFSFTTKEGRPPESFFQKIGCTQTFEK